ncbi:hypothetical protein [Pontibacter liquoris]|nr:hypothetical protein [Pontibacter liquoris]
MVYSYLVWRKGIDLEKRLQTAALAADRFALLKHRKAGIEML